MEKTITMNPLIKFLKDLRTKPFEVGTYNSRLYPVNMGYDKKKSFIYGEGYVTLKDKHTIEPLVIGTDMVKDIIAYHDKYGSAVTLYAVGCENVNDCCNSTAISQLKSLINYPEGWKEYFDAIHEINEKIIEVVRSKWNVEIDGDWMRLVGEQKGKQTCSFRDSLQLEPTTSILCGMFTIGPHIDWIEYEKVVDNFITKFTPKGLYETNDELLKVLEALENESVSDKLEYITNKDVIKMINIIGAKKKGEIADPAQLEMGLK